MNTNRSWYDNASEWAALGKQGKNVRLALLVACSVRKSTAAPTPDKATVQEFALKAGTTPERIMRHLDAWDRASAQRLCPPSAGLFPADAVRLDIQVPTDEEFSAVYDASKSGGRPRASVDEIASRVDVDEQYAAKLLRSIAAAHPHLVASEPRTEDTDGERRPGSSHGKTVSLETKMLNLTDRVEQANRMLTGIISDYRRGEDAGYVSAVNASRESLRIVLSKHLHAISAQADSAA
jgi:hypothetical protein